MNRVAASRRQCGRRARVHVPLCLAFLAAGAAGCTAARWNAGRYDQLEPGALWDATVTAHAQGPRAVVPGTVRTNILEYWASRPLPEDPRPWETKVVPPRLVLARLTLDRDVAAANRFLLAMEPWNASGSEWDVRELWGWRKRYDDPVRIGHRGDYDFTQSVLITLLYQFGDRPDLLYPETRDHLVNTLLVDRGRARVHVPRSLGLVPETENHLLMTETARYLTNQWLHRHGATGPHYDNQRNGLAAWLADLLAKILAGGFHEFNSIPYQGYALQPLMNLEAYAECAHLAALSRKILDAELWRYAFGSLDYRRSAPFRRQLRRARDTDLTLERMTHLAVVWTAGSLAHMDEALRSRVRSSHFALDAATADYRPPEALVALLDSSSRGDTLVRMGRGRGGSPEIYAAGPGYLLAAGGVAPPRTREIAALPIVLLLSDGVHDRRECIHLPAAGRGRSNRTGVYQRLACGNAPVIVPKRFQPEAAAAGWHIYRPLPDRSLRVAVFNEEGFGLLALFPGHRADGQTLLRDLQERNDGQDLRRRFTFPDTGITLTYDPDAPRTLWVMQSADGRPLPRDYRAWPRLSAGAFEKAAQ